MMQEKLKKLDDFMSGFNFKYCDLIHDGNEISNEPALYKDILNFPEDKRPRFHIGVTYRPEPEDETHLEHFTMFEAAIIDGDMKTGIDLAVSVVGLFTGEENYSKDKSYSILDFEDVYSKVEDKTLKDFKLDSFTRYYIDRLSAPVRKEALDNLYRENIAMDWIQRNYRQDSSDILVINNIPPEIYSPTQARGPRAEVYVRHDGEWLEVANIYKHNMDAEDNRQRGWADPLIGDFSSIDVGVGIERCLLYQADKEMGAPILISNLKHIHEELNTLKQVKTWDDALLFAKKCKEICGDNHTHTGMARYKDKIDYHHLAETVWDHVRSDKGFAIMEELGVIFVVKAVDAFSKVPMACEAVLRVIPGGGSARRLRDAAMVKGRELFGKGSYVAINTYEVRPDLTHQDMCDKMHKYGWLDYSNGWIKEM